MTAEQMWHAYCESSGVSEQTPYSAWAFCGGGAGGDEFAVIKSTLLNQMRSGTELQRIIDATRAASRPWACSWTPSSSAPSPGSW